MTDFEQARLKRIEENKRKLAGLGLKEAGVRLRGQHAVPELAPLGEQQMGAWKACKSRKRSAAPKVQEATRLSKRIRGEATEKVNPAALKGTPLSDEPVEGKGEKRVRQRFPGLQPSSTYAAPFTLRSIGVTVWELGEVQRASWAHRFWSNSSCLWHHAYPIGYRACKQQFGRDFDMAIAQGSHGPEFTVTERASGRCFRGPTPTSPWTEVCLANRTGQRISGPLFFGFSDAVTQRAIAALYTPEELAAAQKGETVLSKEPCPLESATQAFKTLEGCGESVALTLASTLALGGRQHSGPDSLREWAERDPANGAALSDFLLNSPELGEGLQRWPAWKLRVAPKLIAVLAPSYSAAQAPPVGALPAAAESLVEAAKKESSARAPSKKEKRVPLPAKADNPPRDIFSAPQHEPRRPLTRSTRGRGVPLGGRRGTSQEGKHVTQATGGEGMGRKVTAGVGSGPQRRSAVAEGRQQGATGADNERVKAAGEASSPGGVDASGGAGASVCGRRAVRGGGEAGGERALMPKDNVQLSAAGRPSRVRKANTRLHSYEIEAQEG